MARSLASALLGLLIGLAGFGAGYLTRAMTAKSTVEAHAARARAVAVTQAVTRAQDAETRLIVIHDKAAQAAEVAHVDIAGAAAQPGCHDDAVLAAWRGGLERVREAGEAGASDPAAGAAAVQFAGPGVGEGGGGPGELLDRTGTRAGTVRSETQGADRSR